MAKALFDMVDLKRRMQATLANHKHELNSLRTGRASSSMLDPVVVDAYGSATPLIQCANVTVPEPRLLSVQVWDRGLVGAVERAIFESNLGMTPQTEGQVIRLRVPELTQDRRKEMVKVAHKYTENAKIAARHIRRDGIDTLKLQEKEKTLSEDEVKKQSELVQKETDNTIAEMDNVLVQKEKEIMTV
jgi:ribosome recycling factor